MNDYYLKGEERFGFLSSLAYSLSARIPQIRRFYDFVVKDVEKRGFADLLDIGTGPGYVPFMLSDMGRHGNIYAIDPSINMIRIAKSKARNRKIVFGLGSSRHVPFKRKFDLIISTLSFHHWANRENDLTYLAGFLKRRGEIRVYEFEKDNKKTFRRYFVSSHSVSKRELVDAAKKSGLRIKDITRKDGFIRATFVK
jgi:ubiquinone/menaquinone biosynthesis C-methylase UbiE